MGYNAAKKILHRYMSEKKKRLILNVNASEQEP